MHVLRMNKTSHLAWMLTVIGWLTCLSEISAADTAINGKEATPNVSGKDWEYLTGNFTIANSNGYLNGTPSIVFTGPCVVNRVSVSPHEDVTVSIGARSDVVKVIMIGYVETNTSSGGLITQTVNFNNSTAGISIAKSGVTVQIGTNEVFGIGGTNISTTNTPAVLFTNTNGTNYVNIEGQRGLSIVDTTGHGHTIPPGVVAYPLLWSTRSGSNSSLMTNSNDKTQRVIVGGAGNEIIRVSGADGLNVANRDGAMLKAENGFTPRKADAPNNGNNGHGSDNPLAGGETQFANGGKASITGSLSLGDGDNMVIVEGGNGGRGGDGGDGANGGDGADGNLQGANGADGGNGGKGGNGWHGGDGGTGSVFGNIETGKGNDVIIVRGGAIGAAGVAGARGSMVGAGGDGGLDLGNNGNGHGGNGGDVGLGGNAGNGGSGGDASIEGNIKLGGGDDKILITNNRQSGITSNGSLVRAGNASIIGNIDFGTGNNTLIVDMSNAAKANLRGSITHDYNNGGSLDLYKTGEQGTILTLEQAGQGATTLMQFTNVYLNAGGIESKLAAGQLKIGTLHLIGNNTLSFTTEAKQPEIERVIFGFTRNIDQRNNPLQLTIDTNLMVNEVLIGGAARFTGGALTTSNLQIYQNATQFGGFYDFHGNLLGSKNLNGTRDGDIIIQNAGKLDFHTALNVSGVNMGKGGVNLKDNGSQLNFYLTTSIGALNAEGDIDLRGNNITIIGNGGGANQSYAIIESERGVLQLDADKINVENSSWLLNYAAEYAANEKRLWLHTTYNANAIPDVATPENSGIADAFDKLLQGTPQLIEQMSGYKKVSAALLNETFKQLNCDDSVSATTRAALSDISAMNDSLKNQFNSFRNGHQAAGLTSLKTKDEVRAAAGGTPAQSKKSVKKAHLAQKQDIYILREWNGFVQFFGGFGNQETVGNNNGYEFGGWGLMTGLDYLVAKELRFGALFGYSHNRSDIYGGYGMSEDNVLRFGAYGSYNWEQFFFDSAATCGVHFLDSKRNFHTLLAQGSVRGERTGFDFTWLNHLGYKFEFSNGIMFTPVYSLAFGLMHNPAYTETGSEWAQKINAYTNYSLLQNLDFKLGKMFLVSPNLALLPEAWVGWELEYLNSNGEVATSFAAAPQNTWNAPITKTDANRVTFGVGLSALVYDSTTIFGRWDQKVWGGGYESAFTFGVQINF